jgi:hypothetical protein
MPPARVLTLVLAHALDELCHLRAGWERLVPSVVVIVAAIGVVLIVIVDDSGRGLGSAASSRSVNGPNDGGNPGSRAAARRGAGQRPAKKKLAFFTIIYLKSIKLD